MGKLIFYKKEPQKKKTEKGIILPLYFGWQVRVIVERVQNWRQKVFGPFKNYWQYITAVFLMIGLAGAGIFFYNHYQTMAASYSFSQTDWSGGADTNATASHATDQTGWDKYYSKDDLISTGTEINLISTTSEKTQTTTEDFNTGTTSNAFVEDGKVYLKYPDGAVCLEDSKCFSGYCTDGVCCDVDACSACQSCNVSGSEGNCAAVADTRWGAGLYGCEAGSGDDAQRCYNGICSTCSTGGGKMSAYTCTSGGCSTVVGMARESDSKVCWRAAGYATCTSGCGSYGGCISENWNDTGGCAACVLFYVGPGGCSYSLNTYGPYHNTSAGANNCFYRSGSYNQSCGAIASGKERVCICNF